MTMDNNCGKQLPQIHEQILDCLNSENDLAISFVDVYAKDVILRIIPNEINRRKII